MTTQNSSELVRTWNSLLIGVLIMLIVSSLVALRLERAPDLFADEGLYVSVSNNLAQGRGLVENDGRPFMWHPPLYLLVGAGYLQLFALTDAGPITQILAMRQISALAAAGTVGLVFALGWQLRGMAGALGGSLLFALDPYIQRINRRSMLEPLGCALAVLGVWLFLSAMRRRRWLGFAVGAGVIFGLAGLTKEFLLLGPIAALAFTGLFRRDQIVRAGVTSGVAAATYGLYPLWLYANGLWPAYVAMKGDQFYRLGSRLGGGSALPPAPGVAPGAEAPVSLWENLALTAPPYFWSYVLLVVGGLLIALIGYGATPWVRWRPHPPLIMLATWAALNYLIVFVSLLFGSGSDQFLYYVIVPATILSGWGLAVLAAWIRSRASKLRQQALATAAFVLLTFAMTWNISVYVRVFAVARDDSYVQLVSYIQQHIPPGTTLISGSDVAAYILPEYDVRFDRKPAEIEDRNTRYVILSTKDRWGGYNQVSREFYDWVSLNGEPRFVREGPTFWELTLFELKLPEHAGG
jgi:4-amino-4-deoxy-L-arabinose transferase-like glycosyltransferase